MDYKSVIEEQIRTLQKLQDNATKNECFEISCKLAETISKLCFQARDI
ncbi:hypothetical protein Cpap_1458 [Ruminiclostridium papyrosolvens DSM 2782]|uniref:Uncharacterized protein n=1 Tax=Ruminiclostridium papyrosolvens DSM 2782 TaxID=588581 RepID=F1TEA0_9FIRM|nr:hypothetical protein [Ruminiclostridium papyrosolvens]EGD47066.1 hypothetical protein Cpap_1458 [Ruminiclostridium papyrosolvens DSM 2782]WES36007.1 hypothetical protein P0092_08615 [Ruminiclostridium papyrosolvens DSM 2782]WES36105.1 hypothetical protein P0092_09115 [Ruminiclostridium papyrosolvens DSM 2782]